MTVSNSEKSNLCVYEFTTDEAGTVEIFSDEILTAFDPETLHVDCLAKPCNISLKLEPEDEVYILAKASKNLKFTAELTWPIKIGRLWEYLSAAVLLLLVFIAIGLIISIYVIKKRIRRTGRDMKKLQEE